MDLIKVSVNIPRASVHWIKAKVSLPSIAEQIVVIGSPLGLEQTISEGIISSVREIPNKGKILQISAPISSGSSGSPVVNMRGQVVGVATFYLMKGQSLNFAIPAQYLVALKPFRTRKTLSEWTNDADQTPVRKKAQKSRLFVQTEPEGARLRILNIELKFYQGIMLNPGRYHVEVSADGYEMEKVWIKVEPGEKRTLKISLKKMPQSTTKDPDKLLSIGNTYFGKKEYKKAIAAFKQAIRINPDDAMLHFNLGLAYNKLGRHRDAIAAFKQAISIKSDYYDALNNLGFTYNNLGRYSEAVEAFKQVISIKSDYYDALSNLGVAYVNLGRYSEAVEALKQAIRISPDDAMLHFNLGITYFLLGRHNEAIEAYKQAIRIDPDFAKVHHHLGSVYAKLGRYSEAVEAFKQVIRIDPDAAEAHFDLGLAYNKLGRHSDAIEPYKQAIRIDPDHATAHLNLGLNYLIFKNTGAALEQYKILKTLDKERANKLFNLIYK